MTSLLYYIGIFSHQHTYTLIRQYGLIGHPLGHSFSKTYFTEKFSREGIDVEYLNFDIPNISGFTRIIHETKNLCGLNVTIPYKEKVIPYLDRLDPAAEEIGAVNTINIKDGKLAGFNTDYIGFINSIKPMLLPHDEMALVLGTGGSSKAVIYGLSQLGLDYNVVSRNPDLGQLAYGNLTEKDIHQHTVIINTTPLGMFPNVTDAPPLPYQYLSQRHLLFDLIYNPEETMFLGYGHRVGARVKNGLEMLEIQAEEAWVIWNG